MSGRLTQATVEEVKERADLVELVRADTELRKAGIEWVGRCPFHQERSGSFYVNPVKKLYHCYGCGVRRRRRRLRARRATRSTSSAPSSGSPSASTCRWRTRRRAPSSRRGGAGRTAGASCWRRPRRSTTASCARARWPRARATYLTERGVTWEMAERFQLGFSPDERQVIAGRAQARASPTASSTRRESRGGVAAGRWTAWPGA